MRKRCFVVAMALSALVVLSGCYEVRHRKIATPIGVTVSEEGTCPLSLGEVYSQLRTVEDVELTDLTTLDDDRAILESAGITSYGGFKANKDTYGNNIQILEFYTADDLDTVWKGVNDRNTRKRKVQTSEEYYNYCKSEPFINYGNISCDGVSVSVFESYLDKNTGTSVISIKYPTSNYVQISGIINGEGYFTDEDIEKECELLGIDVRKLRDTIISDSNPTCVTDMYATLG